MMMELVLFNTHDVVLLITVYQCVLFSVLVFFTQRQPLQCNLLLAGFLLATAAIPLDTLINFGAGMREWMIGSHPNWFYVFEFGYWVQGPLLLWYIRSLVYKNYSLEWWDLLYLSPFLLYFFHQFIGYHLLPSDLKAQIQDDNNLLQHSSTVFYINLAREFLRVFFGIICVIELNRYRAQIKKRYSSVEGLDFTWLNFLTYGFLTLWGWALLIAALVLYSVESGVALNIGIMGLTANYVTCLLIGVIMIIISSRPSVFSEIERINSTTAGPHRTHINLDQVEALEALMQREKPYLDPSLTLDTLAASLSVSPRTLSHIINRHYGYNFFEFVNKYRIDAAKEMLLTDGQPHATVLDIMYKAGFNSKATFNNFFKKSEGMTPREYRKRNMEGFPLDRQELLASTAADKS
ncbi:helix-turn-helix domain-containing protein [Exilibacterium tricleocarpae]|uniref:Helix-turn-helix domain-containing protein n=1 Tax=Exilibacterium tricleocarpae TaxID=2591008 RepID=A0A545SSW9_9GAMM|nr:helix-turn-helix domain-containing protein [Exilibacterium tricleocarpae]TQV68046.1 helix-turn-helix domain-containing protein [Exilibacterium tricleocarpae]